MNSGLPDPEPDSASPRGYSHRILGTLSARKGAYGHEAKNTEVRLFYILEGTWGILSPTSNYTLCSRIILGTDYEKLKGGTVLFPEMPISLGDRGSRVDIKSFWFRV